MVADSGGRAVTGAQPMVRWLVGSLLVALMFFDKPFAYLGVGSLHVTEAILAVGVSLLVIDWEASLARLRTTLASAQGLLLLIFVAYETARTVPCVARDGLIAARDAVVWAYALFAIIVVVAFDRTSCRRLLERAPRVALAFVAWVPVAFLLYVVQPGGLAVPFQPVPLLGFKLGDLAVHLAGCLAILVAGRRHLMRSLAARAAWIIALVWSIGWVLIASLNRAGMTAALAGLVVLVLAGYVRDVSRVGVAMVLVLATWFVTGPAYTLPPNGPGAVSKEIAARSVVDAIVSIPFAALHVRRLSHEAPPRALSSTGALAAAARPQVVAGVVAPAQSATSVDTPDMSASSGSRTMLRERTISWRLRWWRAIVDYTFHGPYLWWGKGYGLNLADDDGFRLGRDPGLRSPHNAVMTLLARSGLPGAALFCAFVVALLVRLIARVRSGTGWARGFATVILVYLVASLVVAMFDVYLEGPMGGVWFWALVGFALTATSERNSLRGRQALTTTDACGLADMGR
jgi:O-Antigen ligase